MRDLLRRMMVWLFPPHDPDALAALDGGPGAEPEPRHVRVRLLRLDADGQPIGQSVVTTVNVSLPAADLPCVRVRDVPADRAIHTGGPTMINGILTPYGRYLLADHPVTVPPHLRHPPTGDPGAAAR